MQTQITIDARQLKQIAQVLPHLEKDVPKVLAPAINRALDKGRTTVKRQIRKIYVIKAKDIPVKVVGAKKEKPEGAVIIAQGMLPLNRFEVKPPGVQKSKHKRPIFARVKRGAGRIMPGAFVPANTGDYTGPFIREKGAGRLPIHKLFTIGASIMASQPSVGPVVNEEMGDTLAKRIDHEVERLLKNADKKKST